MSDELLADLRRDEGWKAFAYDDANGQPVTASGWVTIGYGFLVDERKGVGIPRPVAEFWLRYAVNERLAELQKLWPPYEKQHPDVQRALGNLAYQIGPAGVVKFKLMLAALENGDRELAAFELLDSKLADQTPARTNRTADLIRGKP